MNKKNIIEVHKVETYEDIDTCINLTISSFEEKHLCISKYRSHGIKEVLQLEIKNPFSLYDLKSIKFQAQIVAYVELKIVFPLVYLNIIAVNPLHKGMKIGKFFIDSIIDEIKKDGYKQLRLDVFKSNSSALKFYERFPFKCINEKNICKLLDNQQINQYQFSIINYPQFFLERVKSGFAFLRVLYNNTLIEFTCINDDLIVSSDNLDYLNIGSILIKKLSLKDLYFFNNKCNEVKLNYDVIDCIYTLEMTL